MCSECHQSPCSPRCPNAKESAYIHKCSRCGEKIYVGEDYADINGDFYCEPCIENMPYSELVTICGGEWRTADYSYFDDGADVDCDDMIYERLHDE